ncbi:MAG: response regulator [Dehalococcoidia bacterium]|jgi:two-component system KDP operon response regulator KdpE
MGLDRKDTNENGAQGGKVLVVEDDPAVNRILRVCLRSAGFDATQAETGGDALRQLEAMLFDAVLLDLGLPDGRGGDVLKRLQDAPWPRSPVWVVISALDEDEAARRYGPIRGVYIPKPFDPWEVIRTLQRLLASRDGASFGEPSLA